MDRFVKMYDLRMNRFLSPLQCFVVQPSYLRFMSSYTRRIMVLSEIGSFIIIEDNAAVTPSTPVYQANLTLASSISSVAIADTAQAVAFGDSSGYLHLWSESGNPSFCKFPKEPEFASAPRRLEPMDIDNELVPLSVVPMPFVQEPLLSDWPKQLCEPVSRRPPPVNPDLLRSMKVVHGIGYAPNPGNRKRNQVPYKLKDIAVRDQSGKKAALPDSPLGRDDQPHMRMVPKRYRKVFLKYSKFGEDENEMIQHYNRTNFAGLEPNIPNSYCNAMLQVLYFIEPLRAALQSHHNMNKEFDLAEELGFLFHMQDCAKSGVLQANNFLRTFRTIPEATALGLVHNSVESDVTNHSDLGLLIQNWNRFILQQINTETSAPLQSSKDEEPSQVEALDLQLLDIHDLEKEEDTSQNSSNSSASSPPPGNSAKPQETVTPKSLVEKLFGTSMQVITQFRIGRTTERLTSQFLFNLNYSSYLKPTTATETPTQYVPFSDVVKNSICSQVSTKSWDQVSETYQPMTQTKKPCSLPDILVLNCSLKRDEEMMFWKRQTDLHQRKMEVAAKSPNAGSTAATDNKQSDAWNVFVQKEGLDFSFETKPSCGWVPLQLCMSLDHAGELNVASGTVETCGITDGDVSEYQLYASVAHIKDPRTGGNLVAHIHVSEPFHKRKEGITHSQWYLFNDFQVNNCIICLNRNRLCFPFP